MMGNMNTIAKAAVAVTLIATGVVVGNEALKQAGKDLMKKA